MVISHNSPIWQMVGHLSEEVMLEKPKLKIASRDLDIIAARIAAKVYRVWYAVNLDKDVAKEFNKKIMLETGNSAMARVLRHVLHITKEEFASDNVLGLKHAQMAGALEMMDLNWHPHWEFTVKEAVDWITRQGGLNTLHGQWIGICNEEQGRKAEEDRRRALKRKEFDAWEQAEALRIEAESFGMSVEAFVTQRNAKEEIERYTAQNAKFNKALQQLALNAKLLPNEEGSLCIFVSGKHLTIDVNDRKAILSALT